MKKSTPIALWLFGLAMGLSCLCLPLHSEKQTGAPLAARLNLETKWNETARVRISSGTYAVYENREKQSGRLIHLQVVVLHARRPNHKPDPVFLIEGGPGADATADAPYFLNHWLLEERDMVFVSQRGTAGDNLLSCPLPDDDAGLQAYLEPLFAPAHIQSCLEEMKKTFDLTCYSTFNASDDLDEVRAALGYARINLIGISYGTRFSLVHIHRHPKSIRTVALLGSVPIAFTNPLYHASSAQAALELIFAACAHDPACHAAFPKLEDDFWQVMQRLQSGPVPVTVAHPRSKSPVIVRFSQAAFAESVRLLMYDDTGIQSLPLLIHGASQGDFRPFAQAAVESNWDFRHKLAIGTLLCVTCAEDVDRIDPALIPDLTAKTFLGDIRVRSQMAACTAWPKSILPKDYGEPIRSDLPVLLFTGRYDPVTPPRWGDEAARHLSKSLHVVIPAGHVLNNLPCQQKIYKQFLATASVQGLDLSCAAAAALPSFALAH